MNDGHERGQKRELAKKERERVGADLFLSAFRGRYARDIPFFANAIFAHAEFRCLAVECEGNWRGRWVIDRGHSERAKKRVGKKEEERVGWIYFFVGFP